MRSRKGGLSNIYLYSTWYLLYCIPGCKWSWLTVQKPAKMRARSVGLRGRTLKSRLSGDSWELERDGLRNVKQYLADIWPIILHTWVYIYGNGWQCKTGKSGRWHSWTAQAHPKIEVIWRHMRARERWFEECIAILYLISDLLYGVPGCIWEWLTEQKPAKLRARAVGLRGRTLFSTFLTLSYGEIF